MTLGLPHFSPSAVGADRVLDYNYWCTGGVGMAIVARESDADDWAAYIGADDGWSEQHCVAWTCQSGAKLTAEQAARWFPDLPAEAYRP